jgi:cell division protein FtsB
MRLIVLVAVVIILSLQYKAWFSDVGYRAADELAVRLRAQQQQTAKLAARNSVLAAEVMALNTGTDVMEARARMVLGMIRQDEVFVLVNDTRQ